MQSRTDKDLERTTEKALDRLAHGWDPLSLGAVDDDEVHVVANLEALSLLAYAVEPEAPSDDAKARLLAAVAAEPRAVRQAASAPAAPRPVASAELETNQPVDVTLRHQTGPGSSDDAPRDLPMAESDPGDLTLVGLGAAARDVREGATFDVRELGQGGSHPVPRAANSNVPLYVLAAGLILCLIGLGFLYGQLQAQNDESRASQARLEAQLQRAQSESESWRARMQMVTDVARWAYPMRNATVQGATHRPDPGEVRPDGIVYVCGQHQQWYLSLSGFDPPPEGKVYHLWFKTEGGLIDAGPIDVSAEGRADLGETSMPKGTQGFMVSLEDSAEGPEIVEPHGQIILKGEKPVEL